MSRWIRRLFVLIFLSLPVKADEIPSLAIDSSPAHPPDQSTAPSAELVELMDGAASANDALNAFVAASASADYEAALMMVDPPIRRLLMPEIAIEKFAVDSTLLEKAVFGENTRGGPRAFGGVAVAIARRDLVKLQKVEILSTRRVDDSRIAFTVMSTDRSYNDEGTHRLVHQFLAVRRSDKWYIFRPFGMLTSFLSNEFYFSSGASESSAEELHNLAMNLPLKQKQCDVDGPLTNGAEFELQFVVPIEDIHQQLVMISALPAADENLKRAARLHRLHQVVENKTLRGDYADRNEFQAALMPTREVVTNLLRANADVARMVVKLLDENKAGSSKDVETSISKSCDFCLQPPLGCREPQSNNLCRPCWADSRRHRRTVCRLLMCR